MSKLTESKIRDVAHMFFDSVTSEGLDNRHNANAEHKEYFSLGFNYGFEHATALAKSVASDATEEPWWVKDIRSKAPGFYARCVHDHEELTNGDLAEYAIAWCKAVLEANAAGNLNANTRLEI